MIANRVALAALAALIAGLLAASCGNKSACSAATCPTGCCDAKDMCQLGTALTACGAMGNRCSACTSPQVCAMDSRNCVTGSGGGSGGGSAVTCANSCLGCCDGAGTCQSGDAMQACGARGLKCSGCMGGQSCVLGECRDAACMQCVSGTSCVASVDDSHCGSSGITCTDCTANGATCNAGSGVCQGGTCGGCRDAFGRCQAGDANGACGSVGNPCVACGVTQACIAGTCTSMSGTGGGSGAGGGGGMATTDNCTSTGTITFTAGTATIHTNLKNLADDTLVSCGAAGGHDSVFRFVLGATFNVTVTVDSATSPVALSIRTGCNVPASEVACSTSNISTQLAGGTYFLWVDALSGEGGDTSITITLE
jgi:hypothetical protein